MSYSPHFVLEGGAKEKMTLICACQPWHPCYYLSPRILSVRAVLAFPSHHCLSCPLSIYHLSQPALKAAQQVKLGEEARKMKKQYNITPKDCGFDLGDPVLSEAAKVLRLLHIQELRYLQTHINELIVAVQAITAKPKTDQSLGRVGKWASLTLVLKGQLY